MKVTVYGQDYVGPHLRELLGVKAPVNVKMVLTGTEASIVNYIREQFSTGVKPGDDIRSIEKLEHHYTVGNEPLLAGCGCVFRITQKGNLILDNTHKVFPQDKNGNKESIEDHQWLNVGTVDTNQAVPTNLNTLVPYTINKLRSLKKQLKQLKKQIKQIQRPN